MFKKFKFYHLINILFWIFIALIIYFIINLFINNHLFWFIMLVFGFQVINVFIFCLLFTSNKNTTAKISWFMALCFVPIFTHAFYLAYGLNFNFKKYQKLVTDKIDKDLLKNNAEQEEFLKSNNDPQLREIVSFLSKVTHNNLSTNSTIRLLDHGNHKYNLLFSHLRKAKNFINIEYYLVHDGDIFRELKMILLDRLSDGIEVRILFDYLGILGFPLKHIYDLRKAGAKVVYQNKFLFPPFVGSSNNYRHHRKIVIIDNEVAFFGGMNIGDEYISKSKKFGFWKDSHYFVKGTIISSIALIFAQDWVRWTKEKLDDDKYLKSNKTLEDDGNILMFPSGPNDREFNIKQILLKLISSAKKTIWITTPYFSPDDDIINALKRALVSGIKIKILIPGRADKQMVYFLTKFKSSQLIKYGAEVFMYKDIFIHSKTFIFDSKFAIVGSINLDHRSLFLNFELSAFVNNKDLIYNLEKSFKNDLEHSKPLIVKEFEQENYFIKTKNLIFQLIEPFF